MWRMLAGCAALLTLGAPAAAEVYQWTDANGKVHFTDKPPANRPARTLDIPTAPAAKAQKSAPASGNNLKRQQDLLKTLDEEKQVRADKLRKSEEERTRQAQNCTRLREQQRQYNEGGRFYTIDKSGEQVWHTDEEIAQQQQQVNAALERCP